MKRKIHKNNSDCCSFEDISVDKSRRDFIKKASIITMVGSSAFILEACSNSDLSPTAPDPDDKNDSGNSGGDDAYNYDLDTQTITINISLLFTSLQNIGSVITLTSDYTFDSKGIVIFRSGSSSVQTLSRQCTNDGNAVNFNSTSYNLFCPSCNSIFDLNGNVISGPANSSLKRYSSSINAEGTIITIKASD